MRWLIASRRYAQVRLDDGDGHDVEDATGVGVLRVGEFVIAEFWLNLQNLFELRLAEAKSGKLIKKLPRLKLLENIHA